MSLVPGGRPFVFAIALSVVLIGMGGCTQPSSRRVVPAVAASVSSRVPASRSATAEAQLALEDFLKAWVDRDLTRYNSLVTTENVVTELTVNRVVVDTITPVPWKVESLPAGYDDRVAKAKPTPQYRVFFAPIRHWDDSAGGPGERLPWHWFLIQGTDGKWRVFSWGAG